MNTGGSCLADNIIEADNDFETLFKNKAYSGCSPSKMISTTSPEKVSLHPRLTYA